MSIYVKDIGYSSVLVAIECGNCHIAFGIPANLNRVALDEGRMFWCPNGHKIGYSETASQRLERELAQAQRERDWARTSRDAARDQAETAERRRRAAKGQLTKVKKRIAAGVCPCCQRTFQDLARHMQGQHPDYAGTPALEGGDR